MDAEKLLSRLDGLRKRGADRFLAKCPAHKDGSPSLSIRIAEDRILLHCFAGCAATDVLTAIGLSLSDLYPERLTHLGQPMKPNHYHARDVVLKTLGPEISLIALAASNLRNGAPFTEADWKRLAQAEAACRQALGMV